MATKKSEKITCKPIMQGNKCLGIAIEGVLSFDDFTNEREGKEWALPLRARGNKETGQLAGEVVDGKWIRPEDYTERGKYQYLESPEKDEEGNNKPLYVLVDGTTTDNPYVTIGGKTQIAPNVVLDEREATPHRDFSASLDASNILWPDGKLRNVRLTLKANNPETLAEAMFKKEQARQRQQASVAKGAKTAAEIDNMIALLQQQRQKVANGAEAPAAK